MLHFHPRPENSTLFDHIVCGLSTDMTILKITRTRPTLNRFILDKLKTFLKVQT